MAAFSFSDEIGCSRPAFWARHSAPASAVMKTSAGLSAPSACMRAISWSALPSMRLMRMPVAFSKAS